METCELCGRENVLTFHHFIPRTLHSNSWFKREYTREELQKGAYLCKHDCHKEIHKYIPPKEMGFSFNTIEKLLRHKKVRKYVKWIKTR